MSRILVVDDEPAILEMLADLYAAHGHRVWTREALHPAEVMLERHPEQFDVLICDGLYGEGPALLARVRTAHPEIRTLLYSGDEELVETERSGGHAALTKPASLLDLLAIVTAPAEVAR